MGHLHGVETGEAGELPEIELAEALMQTCYEMYRRVPAGLSPEIVFFTQHEEGSDYPKQHMADVGGGDFIVKPAVSLPALKILEKGNPSIDNTMKSGLERDVRWTTSLGNLFDESHWSFCNAIRAWHSGGVTHTIPSSWPLAMRRAPWALVMHQLRIWSWLQAFGSDIAALCGC